MARPCQAQPPSEIKSHFSSEFRETQKMGHFSTPLPCCGRRVKNVWSRCPSVLKLTWWLCENTNWLIKLVQRSDCWRCADKLPSPGQGLTLQTHRRDKAVKCSSPQLMTRPLKPKSIAVLRHHPLKRSLDSRFLQILDLGLRNAGH